VCGGVCVCVCERVCVVVCVGGGGVRDTMMRTVMTQVLCRSVSSPQSPEFAAVTR